MEEEVYVEKATNDLKLPNRPRADARTNRDLNHRTSFRTCHKQEVDKRRAPYVSKLA